MNAGRRPVDAAVIYAGRGWYVFPCHQPSPRASGCSCGHADCGSPAKHPRIARGLHAASRDESQIRDWWHRWPRANVAVRTGQVSGLVVVDIDPDHGGDATLAGLVDAHGPLPSGRTVRTGSGGQHLYFRHPGGLVRNDTGRRIGPGVDIRGDGGYVIAPPSCHQSGGTYSLVARGGELPDLPDWLLAALRAAPAVATDPPATVTRSSAWARAALDGELDRLGRAAEGTRNATLNRVAFRLGQIVGTGRLDEDEVAPLLVQRGIAIGLREREVVNTVRSGLHAGEGSPRGPTEGAEPI